MDCYGKEDVLLFFDQNFLPLKKDNNVAAWFNASRMEETDVRRTHSLQNGNPGKAYEETAWYTVFLSRKT